jgi:heat shock protein HslJ
MKVSPTLRLISVLLLTTAAFSIACSRAPTADTVSPLAGTQWNIVHVADLVRPETIRLPYMRFDLDGSSVSGTAGVNRFAGTYSTDGSRIVFSELATTKMAGPPETMAFESAVLDLIQGEMDFAIQGQSLILQKEGGGVITLTAAEYQ